MHKHLLVFLLLGGSLHAELPSGISAPFVFDALDEVVDSDGDGMPDAWEGANGLNSALDDAGGNPDGDPFLNIEEYRAGSDPQVGDFPPLMAAASGIFSLQGVEIAPDMDSDGLPDAWETLYGLPVSMPNAADDPDGDGWTNLEELNGGWNPIIADDSGLLSVESPAFLADTGAYPAGFSTDSDSDGMPDRWEAKYGLNPLTNDALGNPDGDELNNLEEYLVGRNPSIDDQHGEGSHASGFFVADTIGLRADTDGDLMPDLWEDLFGLDPDLDDSHLDPDGDGWTNLEEYNAGTNPQVDEWAGPDRLASLPVTIDTGAYPLGFTYDGDTDGMPDWWEEKYGFNRLVADASGNADGDDFTNGEEYQLGLHPGRADFVFVIDAEGSVFLLDTGGEFVDSDLDGVPNWWERKYFGHTTAMNAGHDTDGDGQSNGDEYVAGLSPVDAASVFKVESLEVEDDANGMLTVRWETQPGRTYHLWVSEGLDGFPASPHATVTGDGTSKSRQVPRNGRQRLFCRIEVELSTP